MFIHHEYIMIVGKGRIGYYFFLEYNGMKDTKLIIFHQIELSLIYNNYVAHKVAIYADAIVIMTMNSSTRAYENKSCRINLSKNIYLIS